jgi:hypothetical protein
MGRELLLDHQEAGRVGEGLLNQLAQTRGRLAVRAPHGDLGLAPAHVGGDQDHGGGGAHPLRRLVLPRRVTRTGRQGGTRGGVQDAGLLVEAD